MSSSRVSTTTNSSEDIHDKREQVFLQLKHTINALLEEVDEFGASEESTTSVVDAVRVILEVRIPNCVSCIDG